MRSNYLIIILLLALIYEPVLLELRVAVVGAGKINPIRDFMIHLNTFVAGIGGTSAAYFLSQDWSAMLISVTETRGLSRPAFCLDTSDYHNF